MLPPGPLMADLRGPELADDEREMIRHPRLGGIILFSRNYESPQQLIRLCSELRAERPGLLIAVDHEGGRVQRFRDGFTRLPPMAVLGRLCAERPAEAMALARDVGWLMAAELIAHGLDFSFAPVLDLDHGVSSVIGDRAFGHRAETVIALAEELMAGMHEAGMATVGKHFPGHGAVAADSHLELPEDQRSYEEIEAEDLRPFARFARAGLDGIMPAHVVYRACDDQPAGFSRFWLEEILRGRLGFRGVIFSDDLTMAGAAVAGDFVARARAALAAGCDMILVCNDPGGARQVLDWLADQDPQPCEQLERMRARRRWSVAELGASERWQRTRAQLEQLEVKA